MTDLALIINPRSHANRSSVLLDQHPLAHNPILSARPDTRQDLIEALKQFADRRIKTIAIDGGDGTLRDVLSVLPDVFGSQGMPDLVILPSGHANVIAADVGTPGRGADALRRVISALEGDAPPLRLVERPLLQIRRESEAGQTLRGFFFGAATFSHATLQVHRGRRFNRLVGAPAVAMFLAAASVQALLPGRHRSRWLAGEPMMVSIDGKAMPQAHHHFLLLATTLHRLVSGVWPFWGQEGGALRWLDIDAPPKHLLRAAPRVARGRPQPWMTTAGYRSGTADCLTIDLASPFVLDGEVFEPGGKGIEVSVGPTVRFLVP